MDKPSPCYSCKNYKSGLSCLAFERIPTEIITGYNDHRSPFPGDNGIHFEEKPADTQVDKNITEAERIQAGFTADYKANIQAIEAGLNSVQGILESASPVAPIVYRNEGVYPNYRGEDVYLNRELTPQAENFAAAIRKPIAVFRDFRIDQKTQKMTSIEEYISIVRGDDAGHRLWYFLIISASVVKSLSEDIFLSDIKGNVILIASILKNTSGVCVYNVYKNIPKA